MTVARGAVRRRFGHGPAPGTCSAGACKRRPSSFILFIRVKILSARGTGTGRFPWPSKPHIRELAERLSHSNTPCTVSRTAVSAIGAMRSTPSRWRGLETDMRLNPDKRNFETMMRPVATGASRVRTSGIAVGRKDPWHREHAARPERMGHADGDARTGSAHDGWNRARRTDLIHREPRSRFCRAFGAGLRR